MAGRRQDLETRIVADDQASKVIDKVAGELDQLEKRDTSIDLTASDQASDDIRTLAERLEGLSKDDKVVVLKAKVTDAERDVEKLLLSLRNVDKLSDEEVKIRVDALGNARTELEKIEDELRQLDGTTADVTVEARGLDDILGKLDSLPGKFGEMGGALSSALGPIAAGGGVAAGVVGIAAGLLAAADHAADLALSAEVTAKLTGDTVENVSKVQQLWQTTGADINDLNDILVQVTQSLLESPELAARLGVSVAETGIKMQDFVTLLDAVDSGLLSVTEQSKLFGEEGIRQVAGLTARYDDLSQVVAGMEPPVTAEDAKNALTMKQAIADLTLQFQELALQIGQFAVPAAEEFFHKLGVLAKVFQLIPDDASKTESALGAIGEAMPTEEVDKMLAAGVTNLDTWRRMQPIIEGIDIAASSTADSSERTVEATSRQASIARTRAKQVDSETRQYLAHQRARQIAENEAALAATEAQQQIVDNFKAMVDGMAAYNSAVSATDWGATELQGAITGMDEFTSHHLALANIAQDAADAEEALGLSVEENGRHFDIATEAGRNNLDAIEAVARAVDVKLAAAYESADGNQRKFRRNAEEIAETTLARLREEMDLSEEQTNDLRDALGLMPEDIETRYELSGTAEAQLKLDLLQGSIDGLPENKEIRVTQKIIAGDYEGALRIIQNYYDDNPAILPVKPVIGEYVYPPGLIPSGSSVGTTGVSATTTAAGVTPMAGPTLPTLMLPVSAPSQRQQPVVINNILNAAVVGDPFAVARAMEDGTRRAARLMPRNQ